MSDTNKDYKAQYERLAAAVAASVEKLQDVSKLLEITAKRMTSTSSNCSSAAISVKHVLHDLSASMTRE